MNGIEALFLPTSGGDTVSREPDLQFCECCEKPRLLSQFHRKSRFGTCPICIFCEMPARLTGAIRSARVCSPCDNCRVKGTLS